MSAEDAYEDHPLLDDLETEEPSPYHRRSKAVQVRRRRFSARVWTVVKWTITAWMAAIPLAFGGYRLASYLLHSPRFQLSSPEDLVVEGNQHVSREEVLNALGMPLAATPGIAPNIFRVRLDAWRKQLETIAWVQSAIVTRAFPHRILVHVTERVPIAFVSAGGQLKLVDHEGVLLDKPEHGDFAFPVLEGLEATGNPADRQARLKVFEDFVQQLGDGPSTAGWLVSEVELSDVDDLKALLVRDRDSILVHFGHQGFAARFQEFLSLLPELRRSNARIYSVDLRYRNQVVVNPQPAATKAGRAPGLNRPLNK
jgi:cell division protein FtsQ